MSYVWLQLKNNSQALQYVPDALKTLELCIADLQNIDITPVLDDVKNPTALTM